MLHPALGRFLQRDPIGTRPEPTHVADAASLLPDHAVGMPSSNSDALDAEGRAYEWAKGVFGILHAADAWLWQYKDGGNLYQSVKSNPVVGTDPSGQDRYVVWEKGTLLPHMGLIIDCWTQDKNGKWIVTGGVRYDFTITSYAYVVLWPVTLCCQGPGRIDKTEGNGEGKIIETIKSDRASDERLIWRIEEERKNPPTYDATNFNCTHWTERWKKFRLITDDKVIVGGGLG
jgi:hypothetical protein